MMAPWWLIVIGIIMAGFRILRMWIIFAILIVSLILIYNNINESDSRVVTEEATIKPIEPSFFEGVEDWLKQHTPEK